ncbi:MAG: hypothetical protein C0404_10430 [Verrucomicrobia bacterium]|nr:hypothetical protein [Verrucomicrobiota bacterium]
MKEPMTWTKATEEILNKDRKPLNYRTLAQRIISTKLVITHSKTPHITLYATLTRDNKACEEGGFAPRFFVEKGMIGLTAWEQSNAQTQMIDQAKRLRDSTKTDLLKRLGQLSGSDFESFVEALLVKMGYQDVQLRGGGSDEGIDLLCQMTQGINQVKTAVQVKCKQPNREVGPKDVRLLRDVLPNFQCSQGVLITTSRFNRAARDAANEQGRLPIILIDGDRVGELAIEHEVGVRTQTVRTYSVDSDFELFGAPPRRRRTATNKASDATSKPAPGAGSSSHQG